jgi:hypothetical protein
MCIVARLVEDKSPIANYLEKNFGIRPRSTTRLSRLAGKKDPNKFYQPGGKGFVAPAEGADVSGPSNHAILIAARKARLGG